MFPSRDRTDLDFAWNEVTGAIGDSVTVLPIVVAVAVLTDLSLAVMLIWFGVFQVVWGLYYGVPISIEPMKALAALVIAGSITTGELLLGGLLVSAVLLVIGQTHTLDRFGQYIHDSVVRGIQFGVALVLLETGVRLGLADPQLAALAGGVAVLLIAAGYWNLSALVVLALGGGIAIFQTGLPSPALPPIKGLQQIHSLTLTLGAVEGAIGQLAMTVGNAALVASVLLNDYFDRDISPDELSTSMGVMNLVAIPFGALPMCHGSGGIAGKYAFGARTATANIILGVGYVGVALLAVGLVAVYPTAMLGVILMLIAVQLGWTSINQTDGILLVVGIGVIGLVVNLAVAFVVGVSISLAASRWSPMTG
ncbi:sulfate transporter family permease [Halosimplex carlsbadense 2-9-1]|uniref:Sulfate transporter family permease n=1 Tax=Halosimplex carlsbadense 2-9-1 TaxID=797114 RepID=M0C8X0_9EURY|nr:putative sulfate/molybdate transporter [Halosimplex carlsbadense]ELZ19680.1 sulfate transporter family permease [Halosimplex carlsbadense 2-9-1]